MSHPAVTKKLRAVPLFVQQIFDAKEVTAMKRLYSDFNDSLKELTNTNSIVGISMLMALGVILSFFRINITNEIRIGPGFIVTALLGMMYGPVAGGFAAGLEDIIKYIVKPSGGYYFPGFTITAVLGGIIYGVFFYKKKCTIFKTLSSKLVVNLLLNTVLNTFWFSILGGKGFSVLIYPRLIKNMISFPLEAILLYLVLSRISIIVEKMKKQKV